MQQKKKKPVRTLYSSFLNFLLLTSKFYDHQAQSNLFGPSGSCLRLTQKRSLLLSPLGHIYPAPTLYLSIHLFVYLSMHHLFKISFYLLSSAQFSTVFILPNKVLLPNKLEAILCHGYTHTCSHTHTFLFFRNN